MGAISAFFVIETNNFKEQERKLCLYCKGTGYLTCAECSTSARSNGAGLHCIMPDSIFPASTVHRQRARPHFGGKGVTHRAWPTRQGARGHDAKGVADTPGRFVRSALHAWALKPKRLAEHTRQRGPRAIEATA